MGRRGVPERYFVAWRRCVRIDPQRRRERRRTVRVRIREARTRAENQSRRVRFSRPRRRRTIGEYGCFLTRRGPTTIGHNAEEISRQVRPQDFAGKWWSPFFLTRRSTIDFFGVLLGSLIAAYFVVRPNFYPVSVAIEIQIHRPGLRSTNHFGSPVCFASGSLNAESYI